ncbi:hypothetical protein [Desulfobacula phenolica]|uniref:PilZ domain-containing protein n=1 Tax=Desulfobacula phenolica TaxID=90732 RepID=A0A1H2JLS3_9BACT|nr:hypothetical protein [Desulfobacula phenolica]SDU57302.1 hypothetical protein SAMN04487931_11384 [Desulfobacula phenolica]
MKKDPEHNKKNGRVEIRTECRNNASVEFIPGKNEMAYHFRIKDFSSNGFGIFVREDSNVLKHIKAGDILMMKYHPEEASVNPISHRTQIIHISAPEPGKHKGHMLVGLLILDESSSE